MYEPYDIDGGRAEAENIALRRIFGPKTEKVTGNWRKLQTGELYNLTTLCHILLEC
jgi:hypothetical protein